MTVTDRPHVSMGANRNLWVGYRMGASPTPTWTLEQRLRFEYIAFRLVPQFVGVQVSVCCMYVCDVSILWLKWCDIRIYTVVHKTHQNNFVHNFRGFSKCLPILIDVSRLVTHT